jgi:hypothetical protein
MPPAVVNEPPAIRSPFVKVLMAKTSLFIPVPNADQLAPFQRAMRLTVTPPAAVNPPPAMMSPFESVVRVPTPPFSPEDSAADQLAPFHRARDGVPPRSSNPPPASRSPLGRVVKVLTMPLIPFPSADQRGLRNPCGWMPIRAPVRCGSPRSRSRPRPDLLETARGNARSLLCASAPLSGKPHLRVSPAAEAPPSSSLFPMDSPARQPALSRTWQRRSSGKGSRVRRSVWACKTATSTPASSV